MHANHNRGGGVKASSEETSMNRFVLPQGGRFWFSNSFLEEQYLVNWSHSNTMINSGAWGLHPEKFPRTKLPTTLGNVSSEDKGDGQSSV